MTQPAPGQPYAHAGGMQAPMDAGGGAEPPQGIVAKIKTQIPLTIAVSCFLFVIFYGFVTRAFDINDRDLRRFLGTSGVCAAATGFLAMLVAAFTRAIDRENSPTTFGPALLSIALLILLAGATGVLLIR